ncbi:MAG: hypothetical protein DWQ34_16585 [Planctomycetota bacterium]|nr:MAG: hypothetical protein DWQ29_10930 [Planctomycetota bacterium]REJ90835.1 MAG: hypothetical protein DWQ34_16585 [Planctomycetota bacterium]REK24307.1 MAG: hypothetical protein DWQ41_14870 [Planctomycetota bacterium]
MFSLTQLFGIAFLIFGCALAFVVRGNIRDGVMTRKGTGAIRISERPIQFVTNVFLRAMSAFLAVLFGIVEIFGL